MSKMGFVLSKAGRATAGSLRALRDTTRLVMLSHVFGLPADSPLLRLGEWVR